MKNPKKLASVQAIIAPSIGLNMQKAQHLGCSQGTVVPRNSGLQNSGLPLSSGQFLGDQLFVPFLCSNSPLLVDSLSSGHFLGKRLSDFTNNYVFCCFLKKHEVINTGEKPHVCSKCEKTFTQKAYLKTHELILTGKKPHGCSKCDKTFTQ